MIDLSGKVVLVTGGGGGIGAAIVRAVAGLGGDVALHDVRAGGRAAELQVSLGDERCFLVDGDLADGALVPEIWGRAVAWRGRIDVLVNNAGIYEPADIDDDFAGWQAAWRRTLEINLMAPGHFCREALRHYRERGGGIIVNMASRAAFRGDDADYMHYAASKAGVVAMTRTDLNRVFFETHGVEAAAESIPLGEVAEPEDIANTVVFLASGLARHATGATFDLNGASYVR